ncbi:MAG: T9SS type A sorting domain-containing protein [candidate division WOR-3 bacterium]
MQKRLPTIISSSAVWPMNPDLVYVPDGLIEGRMLITYAEGNERWLSRHPYLPLYRVCTYQSVLPLVPGGPQDKETMPFDSGNLSLEVYPNPFQNHCVIKFQIPNTKSQTNSKSQNPNGNVGQGFSLAIYDVTGRMVKDFSRLTVNGERSTVVWDGEDNLGRNLSPGVYFVQIKAGAYQQIEKVVLCK